jgi:hypothetical protein
MDDVSRHVRLARPRDRGIAVTHNGDLAILQVPAVHPRVLDPLGPEPAEERGGLDPRFVRCGMRHLLAALPETITLVDAISPVRGDEELDARLGGGFGGLGLQRCGTSADSGDEDIDALQKVGGRRGGNIERNNDGSGSFEFPVGLVVRRFLWTR